jgi:acetyl esterase/lipase
MGTRTLILVAAILAAALVVTDDARRVRAQEGGPKEAALKIAGEPGTEFSGRCAVGDEKDELGGRVPQQISYRFLGEELECEVRQRSVGALEVVSESDGDRSTQRISSQGGTIKLTYSDDAISSSTFDETGEEVSSRNITYCTANGVALKMDLYFPKASNTDPTPTVVFVHGGGWKQGDKSMPPGTWRRSVVEELTARGYLVAAPNYRLAPGYLWPAQIEDVKCAIRYLRANASTYHLDPNRIGAWGRSAGGHLVALLGLTDASAGLEGHGGYAEQSSRVQAVVDMFGPTDLTAFASANARASKLVEPVFGRAPERLTRASPINYVSKDDPPFLILHGDEDPLVPIGQSRGLYDRLKAVGVPANLMVVKDGGHGFGMGIRPTREEIRVTIADFFDESLSNVE